MTIEVERDLGRFGGGIAGGDVVRFRLHLEAAQQLLDVATGHTAEPVGDTDREASPDHEDGQTGPGQDAGRGLQEPSLQAEQVAIRLWFHIAVVGAEEGAVIHDIVVACGNVRETSVR